MAYKLYKRGNSPDWFVDFGTHRGKRVRQSTRTGDRKQAEAFAKRRQTEIWGQTHLGEEPTVTWDQAVVQYLAEHSDNRSIASIEGDKQRLRRWSKTLAGRDINSIKPTELKTISIDFKQRATPAQIKRGAPKYSTLAPSTRNRYLGQALVILNFAQNKGWRNVASTRDFFDEGPDRVRFITPDEAQDLLAELPDYMLPMVVFSLEVGVRAANVRLLEWANVDLRHAMCRVDGRDAKGKKHFPVPLTDNALAVLQGQVGLHWKWVFPYKGRAISKCSNKSWYSAKRRAEIEDFRWHDLRHTWASWHAQNGTNTAELQALGAWSDEKMVARYAHLSAERLALVSANINGILPAYEKAQTTVVEPTPRHKVGTEGTNAKGTKTLKAA